MKRALLLCASLAACGEDAERPGGVPDAGEPVDLLDAAPPDAAQAVPDAGLDADADASSEAGADAEVDAGGCRPVVLPADCEPASASALPQELRCTGLYADWTTRELACDVLPYAPAYQLWSDGADKQRYLWLPPGTKIDASVPDAFVFPEGTRAWKEFRVANGAQKRLGETRLLVKGKNGWLATTYVWSEDGQSALQNNNGVANLHGSGHSVPNRDQCAQCHEGRTDWLLGFDPIMLGPQATGLSMQNLVERGLIEDATTADRLPASERRLALPPGEAFERDALGYLHANCGVSCHNREPFADADESGLHLRLEQGEYARVADTDAFKTSLNLPHGVNAQLPAPLPADGYLRVVPTVPARSLLLARMKVRGSGTQMPRIGSNLVDASGVELIETWIEGMTTARGYPPPAP